MKLSMQEMHIYIFLSFKKSCLTSKHYFYLYKDFGASDINVKVKTVAHKASDISASFP